MLERKTWIHLIDQVPDRASRRFDHVCGPGKVLQISQEGGKYRAFCYRCNEGDSYERQRSLQELVDSLRQSREADLLCSGARGCPTPATHDVDAWPKQAALWFYKAGLSRADIGKLGAYYHAPSRRVVLPIPACAEHAGWWQARALDKHQLPKYLGPTDADRSKVCPRFGEGNTIVLTEDILSAYKVGKSAAAQGWCMMGVRCTPWVMHQLQRSRADIAVWLDPDKAGQDAARKVLRELRQYGLSCRNIVSLRDPKNHTLKEIHGYIHQAC